MHPDAKLKPTAPRALVIIPGTVNYFYNLSGERIAEAVRELGLSVEVRTLPDCVEDDYDWCLLSSITEILHAYGDEDAALAKLGSLRGRYGSLASLTLECVSTPWHRRIRNLSERAGARSDRRSRAVRSERISRPGRTRRLPVRLFGPDAVRASTARQPRRGMRRQDHPLGVRWPGHPGSRRTCRSPHPGGRSPRFRLHARHRALHREGVATSQSTAIRACPGADALPGLVLSSLVLLHGD